MRDSKNFFSGFYTKKDNIMELTRSPSPKHQKTNLTINLPKNRLTDSPIPPPHKGTKPNLKLNMNNKGTSPSGRSLASITNNIPNFSNSGPFSPGLFSARRVWVRLMNGTATTVMVNQNDLIDNLKTHIINKFPNALGKYFDSAELIIKMDLQGRKQQPTTGTVQPPHKKANVWLTSLSPDSLKPSISPVSSTFENKDPNSSNNYSYINLEPDQNVWNILDLYFPCGMNMNEAFIIETPHFEDTYHHHGHNNNYTHSAKTYYHNNHSTSNTNLTNLYQGSASPVNHSHPLQLPTHSQMHQIPQPNNRSLTPNSASSSQTYFQPKPQYSNHSNHPNNFYREKSLSPNQAKDKTSPLPSGLNLHRRSQSNPPQSPISNSNSSTNLQQKANNQAVLLLPKNFSLSSNTHSNSSNDKKRLSLDENFVAKNRGTVTSPLGKNLSNIKSPDEINEEDDSFKPKLKLNVDLKTDPSSNSPNTPTNDLLKTGISPLTETKPGEKPKTKNSDSKTSTSTTNSTTTTPPGQGPPSSSNGNSITKINSNSNMSNKKDQPPKPSRQSSGSKKVELKNKTTTETVLPSISVLVVEDNAINQAILGAFLRKHKIHYEIAKNGQEAVAKWRTGGFHLVLMDIQLPVKSGIEATKEIRHLERINKIGVFAENELTGPNSEELSEDQKLDMNLFRSPVIIVALTASSNLSVDRGNALRAGCNDYLTKPVNLVWLQNKITEWGCMQALIDFDGWKSKQSTFSPNSAKILKKTINRSRSNSQTKTKVLA